MNNDNINHCIIDKNQKISPVLSQYMEWWLLLVDSMSWGLEQDEVEELKTHLIDFGEFSKLLIIDRGGNLLMEMDRK